MNKVDTKMIYVNSKSINFAGFESTFWSISSFIVSTCNVNENWGVFLLHGGAKLLKLFIITENWEDLYLTCVNVKLVGLYFFFLQLLAQRKKCLHGVLGLVVKGVDFGLDYKFVTKHLVHLKKKSVFFTVMFFWRL